MADSIGHKVASGAVWATIDKFGSMGMQFAVNLVLARMLVPEDFGIIGMLAIFIVVSNTLIDSGFGAALVQKKSPSQVDYSTIFFWNLTFSIVLYLILWVSSPFIADFYSMPLLSSVLRVMALNLIFTGIFSIQKVKLQKALEFKTIALVNLGSYFLSALLAILCAYNGYGVWSLVLMQISYGLLAIIILAIVTRWHPDLIFSVKSLRCLFGFGGYIMAANILQSVCQNFQGIIIGKKFSATQMGYFSQAYKLDQITSYSIPQAIVQVMFPVFSSLQSELQRLCQAVLMSMRVISFVVFPLLCLLIIVAEPLIVTLYKSQWLPSVPYFQVLCCGGFFVCLQNVNFYAVAAVGKSRELFWWGIYKWSSLLLLLLIGMNFGIYGVLWGMVLSSVNIFFVNAYLASKHTGLSVVAQLGAIIPCLLTSITSFLIARIIFEFTFNYWLSGTLLIVTYLVINIISKSRALKDVCNLVDKILRNRKNNIDKND
ncbi:MAG: lipopolysaccharide biosynthesis protein [Bacteroides sp.]|nr:lipopolysaccharide biosynthesis protein [Bacteroides sp.]MBD5362310.1 lipopolysaccharide biosynthesis protein [Bacteroides sp.]